MKIEQGYWTKDAGWMPTNLGSLGEVADLILVFGSREILENTQWSKQVKGIYLNAHIIGCSTAGQIVDTQVLDDSLAITAIHFEHTKVKGVKVNIETIDDSVEVGRKLAELLYQDDLSHVFVLADGLTINGSNLVKGLVKGLPPHVSVTGGLAGDCEKFGKTVVMLDEAVSSNEVVALGLYGDRLQVSYASVGGFDSFGPERLITKAKDNVLYELDHKSALDLYQEYLGEYAKELPASGLFFPLQMRTETHGVVRTIRSLDEENRSVTFAGDITQGAYARLMKANHTGLINGATKAATISKQGFRDGSPQLAILVSCVGRKLILQQRVEEEIEVMRDVLGAQPVISGFYSYGEIAPAEPGTTCDLHNATMTITLLAER